MRHEHHFDKCRSRRRRIREKSRAHARAGTGCRGWDSFVEIIRHPSSVWGICRQMKSRHPFRTHTTAANRLIIIVSFFSVVCAFPERCLHINTLPLFAHNHPLPFQRLSRRHVHRDTDTTLLNSAFTSRPVFVHFLNIP